MVSLYLVDIGCMYLEPQYNADFGGPKWKQCYNRIEGLIHRKYRQWEPYLNLGLYRYRISGSTRYPAGYQVSSPADESAPAWILTRFRVRFWPSGSVFGHIMNIKEFRFFTQSDSDIGIRYLDPAGSWIHYPVDIRYPVNLRSGTALPQFVL